MRPHPVLLLLALAGCSGEGADSNDTPAPLQCGSESCAVGEICDPIADRCAPEVTPRCAPGTAWSPGMPAFREATEGTGIELADGLRIAAVDFDADGWTDLAIRRPGSVVQDDFAAGTREKRSTWLLRNDGTGKFEDVTERSGLVTPRQGGELGRPVETVIFADVDNDGDLDAYTGQHIYDVREMKETDELMLSNGDGTFSLGPVPNAIRLENQLVNRGAAAFTDYDRDGFVDLFAGNGAPGSFPRQDNLYKGNGDGSFTDVTQDSGLVTTNWEDVEKINQGLAHTMATWSTTACDFNDDGWPDLAVSSYGRAPNHLFQNEGGAFVNRSVASNYAFDHRTDWSDNESARCFCKLHPDAENCEGVPEPQYTLCETDADIYRWQHEYDREPWRLGGNSGTAVCADVNGDGALDLLTTEIVHWDVGSSSDPTELLINTGAKDITFERPGNEVTGLTREHDRIDWNEGDVTAAIFDFDNDGRPDVYIGGSDYPGTRGLLYRQGEDGRYVSVPPAEGIDQKASHGMGVADFDRDGDLDIVVGHSWMRCPGDQCYDFQHARLFENVIGDAGNWVQLRLEGGPGSNRAAIGARVTVEAGGRMQVQEVVGGHGQAGIQHDFNLHFGLGEACEATVTVRWPDAAGTEQKFRLVSGARYHLVQGEMPQPE